jgi:poly(A) polymerase
METLRPTANREDSLLRVRQALRHAAARASGETAPRPERKVERSDLDGFDRRELRARLDDVLLARHADVGLDALLATGILEAVLPEVSALVGFGDYEWRHKDVWRHTKQVVIQAKPRPAVRWAALLHDVGKVKTRKFENGKITFIGHPELGARMVERIDRREKLFQHEPELKAKIRFLVLHHQRTGQYDGSWTDSAVRRFAREIGEHLEDLLLLSRADMTTKHRAKRRRNMFAIKELQDRITEVLAADAVVPPLPSGIGDEIMKDFGLPPSKRIGELKSALEALVEAGELPRLADPSVYLEYLRARREHFGL